MRGWLVTTVVCLVVATVSGNRKQQAAAEPCPTVCEKDKCPNIGPIKLSDCPTPYLVTDRCGCCQRCDIIYVTTTVSPNKRSEVCQKFSCPKMQLCTLNIQGLPVCKCPSEDLCRKVNKFGKRIKVCGSDGVTYATRCHLKVASCKGGKKIRVVKRGECTPVATTSSSVQELMPTEVYDALADRDVGGDMTKIERRKERKHRKRTNRRLAKRLKRKFKQGSGDRPEGSRRSGTRRKL